MIIISCYKLSWKKKRLILSDGTSTLCQRIFFKKTQTMNISMCPHMLYLESKRSAKLFGPAVDHNLKTKRFKLMIAHLMSLLRYLSKLFKVHMTWKIFSAHLKGLSNCRRMAFFFLKYLFFVLEILTFFSDMQIRPVMTSYCLKSKIPKYWINDISGILKQRSWNLASQKKHNDNLNAVAMATVWPLVLS